MKLKGLNEYDIINYRFASMFIIFPSCTFKCDKDCGRPVCQNSALAKEPIIEMDVKEIVKRYIESPLTHALVCGGLEPFDSWEDLKDLVFEFRRVSADPIIIYTGYSEIEICQEVEWLEDYSPVIIKFGRFIPNAPHRYDNTLGVELASDNQYAKEI